ncbi:ABC transporter ATP-binding protein [Carboxylicivirga linearis]|nr:ABC transporter ATP-binding protein [Carboxylicivirga linearis]
MNILGQDDPYAKVGHVNDRTAKAEKGELVAALRDINLEVKEGEVLGIIGKNGAGKSTLLKLLSRVTSPTTGSIKVKGRLASLLEVGTGFHPEMTGRENIYMNGTIMGMRKWEIDRKLDEIVEFAGVAKYLDTPTKRYSSGMTVRLGFAIAAHLEPEILVVDEVLAVGDAEFQKKAIGKMQDVSQNQGRTVLFVSHNMNSVKSICDTALILENGAINQIGKTDKTVENYLTNFVKNKKTGVWYNSNTIQEVRSNLIEIKTCHSDNEIDTVFKSHEDFKVLVTFTTDFNEKTKPYLNLHLKDSNDELLFISNFSDLDYKRGEEKYQVECIIPGNLLNEGFYTIGIALTYLNPFNVDFSHKEVLGFQIEEDLNITLNDIRCGYGGPFPGKFRPKLKWNVNS